MPTQPLLAFDLGNVLLPFDHMKACRAVGVQYGIEPLDVYEAIFTSGIEREFESGHLSPEQFVLRCSAALQRHLDPSWFKHHWADIFVEDKAMDALVADLAQNRELCLISNTNPWHFEHVLSTFAVVSRFRHRVLSFEVGWMKPDPAIFRVALQCARSDQQLVFVDDIEENVAAASAMGIQTVHFAGISELQRRLGELGIGTSQPAGRPAAKTL